MTGRSYLDRIIARQEDNVFTLRATDANGQAALYVIFVPGPKQQSFMEALEQPGAICELGDWGQVLASNYGNEPSEAVRRMLKRRYGFTV